MNKKIILIILGVAVLAEAIWALTSLGIFSLGTKPGISVPVKTAVSKKTASISLSSPKTNLKIGEQIKVDINIKSSAPTDGSDVILKFDPNVLSVASDSADKKPVSITALYQDYPQNSVDPSAGIIAVSGITSVKEGIVPNGAIGSIIFQAKKIGKAEVSIDFTPGKTTDSNIVETGTSNDLLSEVKNLTINIMP